MSNNSSTAPHTSLESHWGPPEGRSLRESNHWGCFWYKWGCFNLNAHLFDISYLVQSIVMILTISPISKGNPPFVTPETLQCVLQSKTLILLAARKTKLLLKFWIEYIAKKTQIERSLNNHWKAVTHFSFFAISENSVMANQGISLHLYTAQ